MQAFAKTLSLGVSALLLCSARTVSAQSADAISVEAAIYLSEAIAILRENAYRRDAVDWTELRREAFQAATGAEVPADTYEAIRVALTGLGDHHSFLQLSSELRELEANRRRERGLSPLESSSGSGSPPSPFSGRREPEGHRHETENGAVVARVVIPRFGGSGVNEFATRIQDVVRNLDADVPCGWIVDLRGNGGGNMWPMLAGIGPVLGEGVLGSFVGISGPFGHWYYRDGVAGMEGVGDVESFEGARVTGAPYRLAAPPPTAVLIDGGTGSSGEAVAIAFKGRPRTRFVGLPTAGFSTSNNGFRLPDGANMVVTVGVDVDRLGREYPLDVLPDDEVGGPESSQSHDPQLQRAIDWLTSQSDCRR